MKRALVVCLIACSSGPPAPKPPDAMKSTIALDKTTVVAGDGNVINITITALDADGKPTRADSAELTATGTENSINNPMGFSDGSVAAARFSSHRAESKTFTVKLTADGGTVTLADHPTVTVTPAASDVFVFAQQPTDVDAGAVITPAVRLQLRDGFGNDTNYPAATVRLRINNTTNGVVLSGGAAQATNDAGSITFDLLVLDRPTFGCALRSEEMGGIGRLGDSDQFNVH